MHGRQLGCSVSQKRRWGSNVPPGSARQVTGPSAASGRRRPAGPDPVTVGLWAFSLTEGAIPLGASEEVLAPDEIARADRFRFRRDRTRYVVGRARLRMILAEHVGAAPAAVRFRYGPQGKPELVGDHLLQFNLAHSADSALLAVARGHVVGVDIEQLRSGFADEQIAEQFFSPAETSALRSLPASEQEVAFFECWTRKEAFLKGKGGGLSVPLHAFAVAFGPGRPARLLRSGLHPGDTERWKMEDVSHVCAGHVAALAVETGGRPLELATNRVIRC